MFIKAAIWYNVNHFFHWVGCSIPRVPACGWLRQDGLKFRASLDYISGQEKVYFSWVYSTLKLLVANNHFSFMVPSVLLFSLSSCNFFIFFFFFQERVSLCNKGSLELTLYPRLVSNSESPCLSLPNSAVTGFVTTHGFCGFCTYFQKLFYIFVYAYMHVMWYVCMRA